MNFVPYSKSSIKKILNNRKTDVTVFDSIDSTSNFLKNNTVKLPHLAIAEEQTGGRGRGIRSFFSPADCGIYMSYAFNNRIPEQYMCYLTPICAVAVRRAIDDILDTDCQIKWVNDIYKGNKKVCGILVERAENKIIIGIGINLLKPQGGYPSDIPNADAVIDVFDHSSKIREWLIGYIINIIEDLINQLCEQHIQPIMMEYEGHMMLIGKEVVVSNGTDDGNTYNAKVIGMGEECQLKIIDETGQIKFLNSGEVTLSDQPLNPTKRSTLLCNMLK